MKKCSCEAHIFGFNCVCKHIKNNPGKNLYSCEFCGIYEASKPACNKCEDVTLKENYKNE